MKNSRAQFLQILLVLCLLNVTTIAQVQDKKNESILSEKIERILSEHIPDKDIGCSVLIAKDGDIVYHDAFGLASVELEVLMHKNMVFGIGSITKQFTAVSIIKLAEQGKISLNDKVSKYIKDFPPGDYITIENLLRHTSGIKSFEKLSKFKGRNGKFKDYEPIEEIKKIPLEFEPGTKWSYSNSGYFILGYIIEQVTGETYQKFLEENVFMPQGLKNTYYGSNTQIIKNRTTGYKIINNELKQANYLSMSLAYSAGAVFSTTSDLFNWYNKLFDSKIIKRETLEMMCKPTVLKNGKPCKYGMGFFIDEIQGVKTVGHTGGLNGYSASAHYLPKEKIYVSVFSNVEGYLPGILSKNITATVLGKPFKKMSSSDVEDKALKEYEGLYKHEKGMTLGIKKNDKQLFAKLAGNSFKLIPHAIDSFYIDGLNVSVSFIRNKYGEIEKLVQAKTNGTSKTIWEKVAPIEAKPGISVKQGILELYKGNYHLKEETNITITIYSGKLFLQVTGQDRFELIPESDTVFHVKGIGARIEFTVTSQGKVNKFMLFQFGKQFECKRLNKTS